MIISFKSVSLFLIIFCFNIYAQVLSMPFSALNLDNNISKGCSESDLNICVQLQLQLQFQNSIDTRTETKFTIELLNPENKTLENLKVDLWMDMRNGHGHGSAPLQTSQLSQNKYFVENVWFVMPGNWLVRLSFNT